MADDGVNLTVPFTANRALLNHRHRPPVCIVAARFTQLNEYIRTYHFLIETGNSYS